MLPVQIVRVVSWGQRVEPQLREFLVETSSGQWQSFVTKIGRFARVGIYLGDGFVSCVEANQTEEQITPEQPGL